MAAMASASGLRRCLEGGEHGGGVAVPGQHRCQRGGVLETGVHALAVERHDGVRGIAEQQGPAAQVPAVQVQRAQAADRVGIEIPSQVGDQRQRVGELLAEQRLGGVGVGTVSKLGCGPTLGRNRVTVKLPS